MSHRQRAPDVSPPCPRDANLSRGGSHEGTKKRWTASLLARFHPLCAFVPLCETFPLHHVHKLPSNASRGLYEHIL